MYNLNNVKVNETHVCVLRRVENEDKVRMSFVELKFKYWEQLKELERMANNDNRTVLDLQDYVKNSPLRDLVKCFNFCWALSGSYQIEPSIPETSFSDYQTKLEEYDRNNDETGKLDYIKNIRWSYFRRVENQVVPYMMQTQYLELENDPSVLAFSHRRVGWASPTFRLNEDMKVVYLTNFGYGLSSYFCIQIFYKGIGILPYSEWVHYRYASTSQIIRYTRRYRLENNEWMKTMTFTADVYNLAVQNPEYFVKKYIMNEVEEMVSGLEDILNSTTSYRVLDNYFNPGNGTFIMGEDLIRFKGEKISGALNFLDQLKTLVPICNDVASYLKRIMSCNLAVAKDLETAMKGKQTILAKTLKDLDELQPIWDTLCWRNKRYSQIRDIMKKVIQNEPKAANKDLSWIRNELDRRFEERHPEYSSFEIEYNAMNKKVGELNSQKCAAECFIRELQSYLDEIEAHKDYVIEDTAVA